MKQFYTFFLFSLFILNLNAQTDTEFWFAAPEVSAHNANFDRPIILRITAYNQASTVTISQPANVGFTPIVVNVAANSTNSVDLTPWINQIENNPPNTVLNYGLLITATNPVTAYYEVVSQQCLCNPEIFALKGRNALGKNFFIPSQNFVNNSNAYNPVPYSSFDIVATDNNTTVTITPSNNIVGHAAGVPFTITLNRGQTYSATATSQAAAQHLMGSTVTADKPVAITIKDDLMNGAAFGGCADLGGDQLVPIDYIGTKYAVVRGFLNAPFDKVFVLATQNGTTVSVDGVLVTTINTGQTYMVDMPNAARFIETSAPVYVLQLSGFGCELGISILPPIECTGSTSVAITRSTTESLFLNLIVRTGGQNNFLFNGAAGIINGASFAPVPGSGGLYQFAQVTITTGQLAAGAAAIVTNTSDFFHLGIIHGTASGGTRFGYFSNFNRIEVDADGFSVPVCEGFPIQLNANSPFTSATFSWTGPNSFTSTQKNPVINNAQPINAGNYVVIATVSGCPSEPDTVPVQVTNCGQQISGVINTYTPVNAIDVCKNAVAVGSASGFAVGDRVLLIQMKGAQINISNSPAFGDITSYDNAGNYEFGNIKSIIGNQITFVNTIQRSYSIPGLVQLVRVPQYSGNVHVINAPVTCQPWNGSTGGIVVFEASGTVTLSADIDASDRGFRAGVANDNSPYVCNQQDYFYPSNSSFGGRKGEGIFELPTNIINGRGKNTNGGGGGNDTNSGGGGGGNYGTGGRGGNQWTGCPNLPIGGDGGLGLTYNNIANKIFLGGGAGGGHQNDAVATPGTNGGGIIIVKSNALTANGGAIKSFANNAIITTGDGSGGAGAGGTVLLQTNSFAGSLTIDVHGGNGGDNNSHGPGGGGGGGVVWTTSALPGNVTLNLSGGQPGFHSTTNTNHGATAGGNGSAITGLILPESATPFVPLPKPFATAPASLCESASIDLSVNNIPNVSYSWTGANGFSSNQQNPTVNNAAVANSGDYIVAVQDALGCIERDTVTVNVRPRYSFTLNESICNGVTYTRPNGVVVSSSGTYRDTLQTVNGCDSIIVTILNVVNCTPPNLQCDLLCNPDFEDNQVTTPGNFTLVNQNSISCWNTTATDGIIEVWGTGFNGVPAYSGNQFVELNANQVSTLYQDFQAAPGSTVQVSFAHRGRAGVDVMSVSIGPVGGPYTNLGTFSTGNTAWSYYTVNYTFPFVPQFNYSLRFNSISAAGGNPAVGNFLDAITITMPQINVAVSSFNPNCPTSTNGSISLAVSGGTPPYSVVWSAPLTDTTLQVNNLAVGDYIFTVTDLYSCAFTDTVPLTPQGQPTLTNLTRSICEGEVYIRPNGQTATTSGTYNDTLQTIFGCDSVIVTNLMVTTIPLHTNNDTAICRGNSVQLNATGAVYYKWRPAIALSDTAVANPVATPLQTTAYIVTAFAPSQNLIVNGNFESGNTGFTSDYIFSSPNPLQPPGHYTVATAVTNGWWAGCNDHTSGSGNMFIADGANGSNGVAAGSNVWCQTVNVLPNRDYAFSTWLTNLNASGSTSQLRFLINGVQIGDVQNTPLGPCQWNEFYVLWNSGNNTTANICIAEASGAQPGNDFALDDISFSILCEKTDTVLITINRPDTTILNPEICFGNTYTLPDGSTVSATGIYVDTLLTAQGCDSIIITNLLVNPIFNDTVNASICDGVVYTLPNGNTASTSGTYTANLQTIKGCDSIIVTVLDVRPNSFTTVDTFICPNTNFTRPSGGVVSIAGIYSDTLISANGCDSVITTNLQLYPVYAQTITDTICAGSIYTLPDGNSVAQTGVYNIALNTINGCDSLFTVNLTVLSVTAGTNVSDVKCFGGSDGSITVNATGGVNPYTFVMNSAVSQTATNGTTFSNLSAANYSFEITDAKGCTATANAMVLEPSLLSLNGTTTNATCFGFADGSVQLFATGGTPNYQFTLNNSSNAIGSFQNLSAGNYSTVVTDANNCTATFAFNIAEPAQVNVTASPNPLVLKLGAKDSVRLSSNFDPNVVYNWNPSQGLSCYDCNAVLVNALNSITYTVSATASINGNECESSAEVEVIIEPDYTVYVPNMFTPNGDGTNDFFEWFGNKEAIKLMEVQIFNRWGEKVFESEDKNFKWDGLYGGKPAPEGIYIYQLKVVWLDGESNNRYKGSVVLIK